MGLQTDTSKLLPNHVVSRGWKQDRRKLLVAGLGALAVSGCGVQVLAPGGAKEEKKCPCGDGPPPPPCQAELHICAFHVGKDDPKFQVDVQHYCSSLNEELHQCLLYENTGDKARLLGVEYVISDRLYQGLDENEKRLWHPHKYEIEAGLLLVPGKPAECEEKVMKLLHHTWGKTWHTWPDPNTFVPTGRPILMWSAEKNGDVRPELITERDKRLGIKTVEVATSRRKYLKD